MIRQQLEIAAWRATPPEGRDMVHGQMAVKQLDPSSYELRLVPVACLKDAELRRIVRTAKRSAVVA